MNLLDRLQLSFRCHADWDAMEGSEQKRFCTHCQKYVHNLSEMTQENAESFMASQSGSCVRMIRRADGSTVMKNCPKTTKLRNFTAASGAAGIAASSAIVLSSCTEPEPLMGVMPVNDATSAHKGLRSGDAAMHERAELGDTAMVEGSGDIPEAVTGVNISDIEPPVILPEELQPALMGKLCIEQIKEPLPNPE